MPDENVVFVDFGKIVLDEDKKETKGIHQEPIDDSYEKTFRIPKEMGEEMIKIIKEEVQKRRLEERKKQLLSKATEHKQAIVVQELTNEDEDECIFDIYEEEDDF